MALPTGPWTLDLSQKKNSNHFVGRIVVCRGKRLREHIPEATKLLDAFDHFPRWRVADVQASLSGEGGVSERTQTSSMYS